MSARLLRGRVLSFRRAPEGIEDSAAYDYFEDGAVRVADGKVVAAGDYAALKAGAIAGEIETDHRPHLILPGFIDTHLHFPQMEVIASYGTQLLDWLETYTFPAEQKFADAAHAATIATAFFDTLIAHGTTSAVSYGTVHAGSAEAYFAEAERRGMLMIGGRSIMDRNAPEALIDRAETTYDEAMAQIGRWHGRGRLFYAVTCRFAVTSTPAQMEAIGAVLADRPDVYFQTHLSENHDEIAAVRALYPDAPDYLGAYERYGMLGPKSLFGHSIHLEQREIEAMADSGSVAVFCPTSNLFLGSGLFDRARLKAAGVRMAVASDIGGGTSYSMLRTLDEGYKVLALRGQKLDPLTSIYWATLGNAEALGLQDRIGRIAPGTDADLIVLDAGAVPGAAVRLKTVNSLAEELFLLQVMGDDRSVVETYIAGRPMKND